MPPIDAQALLGMLPPPRVKPFAALLAMLRLIRDTQDTGQVARLQIALAGKAQRDVFLRFAATPTGQAVIRERRRLETTLDNHDYLRTLPDNSLGRHYLAFMENEGLSAQGLLDVTPAMTEHLKKMPEPIRLFCDYTQRSAHDLHHIIAGYGRDELGEVCVLAMSYEFLRLRGYKLIATIGPFVVRRHLHRLGVSSAGVFAAVREAAKIGREAAWIPALDIEAALPENLTTLRRRLNITTPQTYNKIIHRLRTETPWQNGPLLAMLAS